MTSLEIDESDPESEKHFAEVVRYPPLSEAQSLSFDAEFLSTKCQQYVRILSQIVETQHKA